MKIASVVFAMALMARRRETFVPTRVTMKIRISAIGAIAAVMMAASAIGATFVVPTDREMVQRSNAIVIATALPSYARPTPEGGIETVTTMIAEETIKGASL